MKLFEESGEIVIIEPDGEIKNKVERIIKGSYVKDIVIVNILCMNNRFSEIRGAVSNNTRLKVFHGGSEEIFRNIVKSFNLDDRKDVVYIGKSLKSSTGIIRSYWNWRLDFKPFSPTISRREGSFGEEI